MRGRGRGAPGRIAVPSPHATIIANETDFSVGWTPSGITQALVVNGNYSGSGTANRTRSDATNGLHGLGKTGAIVGIGPSYYADLVVKPEGRTFLLFQIAGAGFNAYGIFDLTLNVMGDNVGLIAGEVSDLSDGWKFVRMSFTIAAADAPHGANIYHATSGSNFSMAGDITKGLLLDRYVLSR